MIKNINFIKKHLSQLIFVYFTHSLTRGYIKFVINMVCKFFNFIYNDEKLLRKWSFSKYFFLKSDNVQIIG